ncbi:signal peptidase I [Arthrobacter sp.]|uniref:signal peptidase I n=1 Tax=Arthrobacter sp. TaxID=1667 RepID=UPI002810D038|nr:signal peptidase I [Arthrobacter sp.]
MNRAWERNSMGSHVVISARKPPAHGFGHRALAVFIGAAFLLLALRIWVIEPLWVSSSSMEPTVREGSIVLLYRHGDPVQGSLVAFHNPAGTDTVLKRVVAVGGQTVAIEDARLYIDGKAVPEPFVDHSRIDGTYFGPVTVPDGHVFVLGDNRAESIDSREFGPLPREAVEATLAWLPMP